MQLNKIPEYAAYTVGGGALFMASLLVFALAAGVPAHQVAIVGGLFPEPIAVEVPAAIGPEGEPVRPKIGPRTLEEVIESTISRLPTATDASPFADRELDKLVGDVKLLKLQYNRDIEGLKSREAKVAERNLALDEQANLLKDLADQLTQREVDIQLQQQELQRDQTARDESDAERWVRVAQAFASGKPEDLIAKLLAYGPEEGAHILINVNEKMRGKLLMEMEPGQFKEFNDAYSALAE